ncbi:unnamed protein product [Mortierella alpina]
MLFWRVSLPPFVIFEHPLQTGHKNERDVTWPSELAPFWITFHCFFFFPGFPCNYAIRYVPSEQANQEQVSASSLAARLLLYVPRSINQARLSNAVLPLQLTSLPAPRSRPPAYNLKAVHIPGQIVTEAKNAFFVSSDDWLVLATGSLDELQLGPCF